MSCVGVSPVGVSPHWLSVCMSILKLLLHQQDFRRVEIKVPKYCFILTWCVMQSNWCFLQPLNILSFSAQHLFHAVLHPPVVSVAIHFQCVAHCRSGVSSGGTIFNRSWLQLSTAGPIQHQSVAGVTSLPEREQTREKWGRHIWQNGRLEKCSGGKSCRFLLSFLVINKWPCFSV